MQLARILTATGPVAVRREGEEWVAVSDLFDPQRVDLGPRWPVADAHLLAPVTPRIVVGMAHNGSAADRDIPAQAFSKSARSVADPGAPIHVDPAVGTVVAEGEVAVVFARECRAVAAADVADVILGYTIGNDVTATDQIGADSLLLQVKNGDGFTPLGPWVETDLDPDALRIRLEVDGVSRVDTNSAGLARSVAEVVEYVTRWVTMGPGDVILTGAPQSATPVLPGEIVTVAIEGLGELRNPVRGPRPSPQHTGPDARIPSPGAGS